jgi:hypothetical protein
MSRPQKELTEQELAEIETMAGLGLSFEEIASIKGLSDDTLKKHAKPFLKKGKAKAKAQIAQTAYRMASSGKIPSMTMFWLKTQANWREGTITSEVAENNFTNLVVQINQSNQPAQVLLTYLAESLEHLRQGGLNPRVAASIARLSDILLKAAEQGQLEERLSALERVMKTPPPESLNLDFEINWDPPAKQNPAPVIIIQGEKGSLSERLETLEENLTPQRLVLSCLEKLSACDNRDERLRLLYSDDYTSWFQRELKKVAHSAKRGVQDSQKQTNVACKAIREVAYLYTLAVWSYDSYETLNRHIGYRMGCIGFLMTQAPICEVRIWSEAEQKAHWLYKHAVEHLWLELKSLRLSEEKISQQFLNAHPLLADYQQMSLNERLSFLEEILTLLEGVIGNLRRASHTWRNPKKMKTFLKDAMPDRPALLKTAETWAEELVDRARQEAKIATYEIEDRHDEIRKIYQQMINKNDKPLVPADFEPESL